MKLNALSNSCRMAPQGMLVDNFLQIKLTSFNACLNGDINNMYFVLICNQVDQRRPSIITVDNLHQSFFVNTSLSTMVPFSKCTCTVVETSFWTPLRSHSMPIIVMKYLPDNLF